MATLRTPLYAYLYKTLPNGKPNKNGKYHLVNPREAGNDFKSVCNKIFWADAAVEVTQISNLQPGQICEKCLGPLRVIE